MANTGTVLPNTVLTLADWAKRLDPEGKVPIIAELLNQKNEWLDDMLFKEGNLPTGHQVTIRTGLPTAYFRQINQAVPTSKSVTTQVTEQCGIEEAWCDIDADEAELNGNVNAYRYSENQAFIEAMDQAQSQVIAYGNANIFPQEYPGIMARYSSLEAKNAQNIINAGGVTASDQASLVLVGWGTNEVFGIFPKGSRAGLVHDDFGKIPIQGSTGIGGSRLVAYEERWQWKMGMVVKDWRYIVRICNIDIATLIGITAAPDLVTLAIKALWRIPDKKSVRLCWYANRTVLEMLDIQRRFDVQQGGQLKYEDVDGRRVMTLCGYPLRIVDQLLLTESVVS